MSDHTEHPAGGAPERTVTLRPRFFDNDQVTVVLRKRHSYTEHYDTGDEVYYKGEWIGTVKGYTGSLDRKAGRLRIPGKQRRLWTYQTPGDSRGMYGQVSRADCIRYLIGAAKRRVR